LAQACPLFRESLRLDPAPGTLLNLADCEEKTGRLASAWEHFDRLAEEVPATDERRALSVERASSLAARVPRLTIRVPDGPSMGIRVRRDEEDLGDPSLGVALPVNPGAHVVVVSAPGRLDRRLAFTIDPGQSMQIVAEPGPEKRQPPARTAGWITGGVGLAALGAGAVFGALALHEKTESNAHCSAGACNDVAGLDAYESARNYGRVSDVVFGGGVLALAAAAILIFTSRDQAESTSGQLVVSVSGLGAAW
jgi:hypothetical protein